MREEIAAAVVFLSRVVRQCGSIPNEKMETFSGSLSEVLVEKFKNHWYQDSPTKGQAYRCIRISPEEPVDPLLENAFQRSGLHYRDLKLFCELTIWVDPLDVCFRFGEPYGPICTLASCKDGNLENKAHTVNVEEYLQKETDRYNNQVNIVTTRSNVSSSRPYASNHNLVYNGFTSYHQHNYYNNHRHHRNNRRKIPTEQQVNGIRQSPEHVNEVRQQFLNQVNSIAGKTTEKSESQSVSSTSASDESGSSSDGSKSPEPTPEKTQDKKTLQSNKSHQNKGKNTSNINQGKTKQNSFNQGFKYIQSHWGKGSGQSHSKVNQVQKVH